MSRIALLLLSWSACTFSGPGIVPLTDMDAATPDGSVVLGACDAVGVRAMGDQTCALGGDGSAYCWGRSDHGELGVSPRENLCPSGSCSPSPRKLTLSGVTSIGLGTYHGCATTSGGATSCWGLNQYGEYGDGTTVDQTPLGVIVRRQGATQVAGGAFHTCSLATGHVSCSGKNDFGEVGTGTMGTPVTTAVDVLPGAASIAVGSYISCALDTSGGLYCWGRNDFKQIDQTQALKLLPTKVAGISTATQVVAGVYHLCVIHADHSATCWGSNSVGQLGTGMTNAAPQDPSTVLVSKVVELSAGLYHTCARDSDGAVWCFGENYGPTPTKITLPAAAIAIAAGDEHDCAVTNAHTVLCWGANDYGQLGTGAATSTRVTVPAPAPLCP